MSLSVSSTGILIDFNISIDFIKAMWNDSEIYVGWIPLSKRFYVASKRAPAMTTTLVVPSPASISCALLISTNILAVGWMSSICFIIVAPSLVIRTSPFES